MLGFLSPWLGYRFVDVLDSVHHKPKMILHDGMIWMSTVIRIEINAAALFLPHPFGSVPLMYCTCMIKKLH
jgi:hypothetical protein